MEYKSSHSNQDNERLKICTTNLGGKMADLVKENLTRVELYSCKHPSNIMKKSFCSHNYQIVQRMNPIHSLVSWPNFIQHTALPSTLHLKSDTSLKFEFWAEFERRGGGPLTQLKFERRFWTFFERKSNFRSHPLSSLPSLLNVASTLFGEVFIHLSTKLERLWKSICKCNVSYSRSVLLLHVCGIFTCR